MWDDRRHWSIWILWILNTEYLQLTVDGEIVHTPDQPHLPVQPAADQIEGSCNITSSPHVSALPSNVSNIKLFPRNFRELQPHHPTLFRDQSVLTSVLWSSGYLAAETRESHCSDVFSHRAGLIITLSTTKYLRCFQELQTKVKRRFTKILQSRRWPLLGPSPGWKRLLALSYLTHY